MLNYHSTSALSLHGAVGKAYHYKLLETSTTIRVFKLHPGGFDDPLEGEILHTDLCQSHHQGDAKTNEVSDMATPVEPGTFRAVAGRDDLHMNSSHCTTAWNSYEALAYV